MNSLFITTHQLRGADRINGAIALFMFVVDHGLFRAYGLAQMVSIQIELIRSENQAEMLADLSERLAWRWSKL